MAPDASIRREEKTRTIHGRHRTPERRSLRSGTRSGSRSHDGLCHLGHDSRNLVRRHWRTERQMSATGTGAHHARRPPRASEGGEPRRVFRSRVAVPHRAHVAPREDRAIDLDNKPSARREEIDDVAIERMLPTKANAEPTTAKLRPEKCFAAGVEHPAHLASAMKEKLKERGCRGRACSRQAKDS